MVKPFCASPFIRAFVLPDGSFRECCATDPYIHNKVDNFVTWWNNDENLINFRQEMQQQQFPASCLACEIQEISGDSLRTAMNKAAETVHSNTLPQQWSIMFGNTCNLSCWTCNETFSSTIAAHKQKLNILPAGYADPTAQFEKKWPLLKQSILESYDLHENIVLVLLGGEPSYNGLVLNFLNELIAKNLSKRTRLEISTNGTKANNNFLQILEKGKWQYISAFISVDAIGKKAEWLRHGTNWDDVYDNILHYKIITNRVEIHTVVSILNLHDLPSIYYFSKENDLIWNYFLLQQPNFFSITHWDGDWSFDNSEFKNCGIDHLLEILKSKPKFGNQKLAKEYIESLSPVRRSLLEYDKDLANCIHI